MPGLTDTAIDLTLRRIRTGTLVLLGPDGGQRCYGSGTPTATISVRSRRAWGKLLRGSIGLAEAYADGLWDSPDLVALVRLGARNAVIMDRARRRLAPLLRPIQLTRGFARPSSRRRRRRDVAAHYDLGDALFTRMLDPTMTYSCAVFDDPGASLEEAQLAKLELVCQKLELRPDDRVLEIGTGWGSFSLHAAATRGCHVTTTTISADQHAYVSDLAQRSGLSDQITVLERDYRDLQGTYDKLVSLEMIEAVGWRHTGHFFGVCSELLEPHGAMLLQAITIDDRAYETEKATRSFIKDRIFPGGSLPSVASIARDLSRRTDLQLIHLQDLTAHYVPTLRQWRERFCRHAEELESLGYDERFRRLWTLYLAYCEAGFAERRICDTQLVLGKPRCGLSWIRKPSGPVATVRLVDVAKVKPS
jgi:cyclopropane-fatty-acyl-phospholipid synthase